MNNFQQACEMSCARWLSSLPQAPENHEFSEKHNKEMKKLFIKMRGNKYHRFTKATARAILVAAIILALAATAFAVETSRHYALKPFSNYTEYSVVSDTEANSIDKIAIHYIPEGFSKSLCYSSNEKILLEYKDENENCFTIQVYSYSSIINFDTENYDCESVEVNGIEYVLFKNGKNYNGVLFNKNGCLYVVDGILSNDELLAIAQNIY